MCVDQLWSRLHDSTTDTSPGADRATASLSTPPICLQDFKMKQDHVLCLAKM